MKKLSQKERNEVVTKGFLVDYLDKVLDEKLESKLESKLEEKLESKNYVTKEYLEDRLDKSLTKQSKDFYQHMEALIEHQLHSIQTFMESMDDRYVLRREWNEMRGV